MDEMPYLGGGFNSPNDDQEECMSGSRIQCRPGQLRYELVALQDGAMRLFIIFRQYKCVRGFDR